MNKYSNGVTVMIVICWILGEVAALMGSTIGVLSWMASAILLSVYYK